MYILIDRQQMAITHKHRDRVVLNGLAWIECTNAGAVMSLSSIRPLQDFTPQELRLLYKNGTGVELKGYANALAQAVLDMAKRMPETDAVLEEVEAQRLCVMDGDKSSFQYVRGAKKPASILGVFEADPIKVERSEPEELRCASGYSAPTPGPTASATLPPGVPPLPTAARAPSAPSAPRASGTRDTIYRVADEMWAAAGSPTNMQAVLALRKNIMNVLEAEHGVKKTTSSNTLGDWQKSKLS